MMQESQSTERLHDGDAKDEAALIRGAEAAREQDLPKLAAVLYRRAKMADPDSLRAAQGLVELYVEGGSLEAACSEAELLAGKHATSARSYFGQGLIAYFQKDYPRALQQFNLALAAKPDAELTAHVYRAMGDAELSSGAPVAAAQAIASYMRAIESDPGDADSVRALANAYWFAGKKPEAIAALEKAHQQAPANARIREALASAYRDEAANAYASEQYDASLDWANKCLALSPQSNTVLSYAAVYAAYALRRGETPHSHEALKLLLRATQADPSNEWAFRELVYLYLDQKNWDAALQAARRAAIDILCSGLEAH
jgi:tetratricopeptide (TPR) repeat protein